MVGRELLTMCPNGEDHQGHDWGGTEVDTVAMERTSRGMGMMINDFKSLVQRTRVGICDQTHAMPMTRMAAFMLTNFYLMA